MNRSSLKTLYNIINFNQLSRKTYATSKLRPPPNLKGTDVPLRTPRVSSSKSNSFTNNNTGNNKFIDHRQDEKQLPVNVYTSMQKLLSDNKLFKEQMDRLKALNVDEDYLKFLEECKKAVQVDGFVFPILKKNSSSLHNNTDSDQQQQQNDKDDQHRNLLEKLKQDGGDKIVTVKCNVLHMKHFRFFKLMEEIKGLSLNEALLQLRFHGSTVGQKYLSILGEAIIKAKEEGQEELNNTVDGQEGTGTKRGLDLNKTFIADTFVQNHDALFSKVMLRDYIRGRGRYGAIEHVINCSVTVVLQERNQPFQAKTLDPLEFLRSKMRASQKQYALTADEFYERLRNKRKLKPIYC